MGSSKLMALVGVLVLIAIIVCGCSSRPQKGSVVGDWDIIGGPTPATMSFSGNGSYTTEATSRGRTPSQSGQYEQKGAKLIFKSPDRSATIEWKGDNEMLVSGDDGVTMTLKRR